MPDDGIGVIAIIGPLRNDKYVIRAIVDSMGPWYNKDGTLWTLEQAYEQANRIVDGLRDKEFVVMTEGEFEAAKGESR